MALSAIISYYHLLKRTLKALIRKHIADMRKSNCKQREKALALLAQRKPCATRAFAKARAKIKMTQVGNIFSGKVYIQVYGSVWKDVDKCSLARHKTIFRDHQEVVNGEFRIS